MKINLIVIDELGDEMVAQTIDQTQITALGECLEGYLKLRLSELRERYPECRGVYDEHIKSAGEERADAYEAAYNDALEYALAHPDEIDDWDPYEWAEDCARDEMNRDLW